MESLALKFADRPVQFVLVYTREPHANEGLYRTCHQPRDYDQRREYALRTRKELNVAREILIDKMDSTVQKQYGGLPNMIYVIDREGKVAFHDRWADARAVEQFLEESVHS